MKKVIGSQFEIKNINIKFIDHPYYPSRTVDLTLADNQTQQEYILSIDYFGNSGYDELRVKIEGDADRVKLVPVADELTENIMAGSFLEGFVETTNIIEKREVTKEEIKKLKREIIKKGKNHRDIVDFIKYLNRHKLTDYEL